MTRLPVPHRLDADVALTLLEKTFKESVQVVNLPAEEHWNLLRDLRDRGVSGGAVYDADIIECSRRAGADKILTLNRRHFERLAPKGMTVIVPE